MLDNNYSNEGGDGWRPGQLLAMRYQLLEEVGGGSMGVVLRADDLHTGRQVAIKLMRGSLRGRPELTSRFIGEAMAMRLSESTHCVEVLDVGRSESLGPFIVMPFLVGSDLGTLLQRGYRPGLVVGVQLMLQVCVALRAAHRGGIIHCDVKPQNLFLASGPLGPTIQLLDFGIARAATQDSIVSATLGPFEEGAVHGTPHYLAPEQLHGAHPIDPRTDIWAAGTVLYELITGKEAFAGQELSQILSQVLDAKPPPALAELAEPHFAPVYAAILKCLRYAPEERFESVDALIDMLRPFAQFEPAPAAARRPAPPPLRRRALHGVSLPKTTHRLARGSVEALSRWRTPASYNLALPPIPGASSRGDEWPALPLEPPAAPTRYSPWERRLRRQAYRLLSGSALARVAMAAGLASAGFFGLVLGYHFLRLPLAPTASSSPREAAHDPAKRTVRQSKAGGAFEPRMSQLPTRYGRD